MKGLSIETPALDSEDGGLPRYHLAWCETSHLAPALARCNGRLPAVSTTAREPVRTAAREGSSAARSPSGSHRPGLAEAPRVVLASVAAGALLACRSPQRYHARTVADNQAELCAPKTSGDRASPAMEEATRLGAPRERSEGGDSVGSWISNVRCPRRERGLVARTTQADDRTPRQCDWTLRGRWFAGHRPAVSSRGDELRRRSTRSGDSRAMVSSTGRYVEAHADRKAIGVPTMAPLVRAAIVSERRDPASDRGVERASRVLTPMDVVYRVQCQCAGDTELPCVYRISRSSGVGRR